MYIHTGGTQWKLFCHSGMLQIPQYNCFHHIATFPIERVVKILNQLYTFPNISSMPLFTYFSRTLDLLRNYFFECIRMSDTHEKDCSNILTGIVVYSIMKFLNQAGRLYGKSLVS